MAKHHLRPGLRMKIQALYPTASPAVLTQKLPHQPAKTVWSVDKREMAGPFEHLQPRTLYPTRHDLHRGERHLLIPVSPDNQGRHANRRQDRSEVFAHDLDQRGAQWSGSPVVA